ncbi:hypothetical protein [Paraprevotella clara]|nr:hypothetical protein [Paraprevotella clara]
MKDILEGRELRALQTDSYNVYFYLDDEMLDIDHLCRMAHVSASYHSIASTCKLQGYSILEYLKKFFEEITAGNLDFGKLMPSTIGISANKL